MSYDDAFEELNDDGYLFRNFKRNLVESQKDIDRVLYGEIQEVLDENFEELLA